MSSGEGRCQARPHTPILVGSTPAPASTQPCGCPPEPPRQNPLCLCYQPMGIYVEPGKHIHIQCPAHGDIKIYGSGVTF